MSTNTIACENCVNATELRLFLLYELHKVAALPSKNKVLKRFLFAVKQKALTSFKNLSGL